MAGLVFGKGVTFISGNCSIGFYLMNVNLF